MDARGAPLRQLDLLGGPHLPASLLVVGVHRAAGRHDPRLSALHGRAAGRLSPAILLLSELNLVTGTARTRPPASRRGWSGLRGADRRLPGRIHRQAAAQRAGARRRPGRGSSRWRRWPRGGTTFSAPLFAAQLMLVALALGAVTAAMLLGHWYLVTPKLSPAPLRRMMWLLLAALRCRRSSSWWRSRRSAAARSAARSAGSPGCAWWSASCCRSGSPSWRCSPAAPPSLQASTGLLYIGLALVMAGSIAGASLAYLTGVPV